MARIGNETFQMLGDEMIVFLKEHNCSNVEAEEITAAFLNHLANNFSGISIYVPKNIKESNRFAQIVAEFDGQNHRALARRFDVSLAAVYKVLKNARTPQTV